MTDKMTRKSNIINRSRIKGRILSRTRRKKDIIFGGQSIKKQIGILARRTKDFDIFTKKSRKSALEVEGKFDKLTRKDNFYVKKGKNPSTWKVKFIGRDGIRGNEDDETIVDYTKTPKPEPKTVRINGIRYRNLNEEIKAKLRAIRNPKFAFRKEKDLDDIRRIIKAGRSVRRG